MKGQRIGYVRVSTFDQNVDRQLEGQSLDRTFTDKASGKDVNRPQLEALLTFAREGLCTWFSVRAGCPASGVETMA